MGAIVCEVPLLDMRNYHTMLAGASWMAEYGDPDNEEEWEHIQTYSPYHLLKGPEEVEYVLLSVFGFPVPLSLLFQSRFSDERLLL